MPYDDLTTGDGRISAVQSLFPTAPSTLSDDDLVELYAYPVERPWVRATFVVTVDGSVQGPDHRSGSISDSTDRRLLSLLRSLCDVVVVGAGTARAEGYGPVRATETRAALRRRLGLTGVPAIAVVSRSLDLPPDLLAAGEAPTFVLTCAAAPRDRVESLRGCCEVVEVGDDTVDPAAAMEALIARGFQRIHTEGGPQLLHGLLADGCVDEMCLTVSPLLLGGDGYRVIRGPLLDPPVPLQLRQLLHDNGTLFCRYSRAGG